MSENDASSAQLKMDKTEAMILQVEKNRVLYDKSEKDYKDI